MNPELMIIETPQGVQALRAYLSDKTYIAYDSETTGLTTRHEIVGLSVCAEDDKAYYVVLAKWNKAESKLEYLSGMYNACVDLLQDLQQKQLIMHNGLFDCQMAEAYFKILLTSALHTDTMILAHLLNENRSVGLKELASSMYGEDSTLEAKEMAASVKTNGGIYPAEMYKADAQVLAKYGAKDALLTYRLFNDLVPELVEQDLFDFFYNDESMPLLKGPTYDLNTTGVQVDTTKLASLKASLKAECAEAKAFIISETYNKVKDLYPGTTKAKTFNIGSSQQLSWLLFGKYGLEFGKLTDGGRIVCKAMNLKLPYSRAAQRTFIAECERRQGEVYSPEGTINGKTVRAKKIKAPWAYIKCDKETLTKLASKYEWIAKLLEYQKKTKLLSTYVEGMEERIQYGVMRASYLQHGTKTGRYAARNPNLQNLPRGDQRVKDCFIARPGKVFVSADFSQLEPRTFAYYSQDPKLMAAFDGSSDFYSVVGMPVYGKYDCTPQKDGSPDAFGIKYKSLRDDSKVIALSAAYGSTPAKLAPLLGKSIDDTEEDMLKYFEEFPGVRKMMLEAHTIVKKQGYVTNLFGRVRRIPEAKRIVKLYGNSQHWDLPYDARKLLNMACNFRIQSTGASIVNRSAIAFYNACRPAGIECKMISQIHDEIVIECLEEDADDVAALLQHCMENTVQLKGVGLEAIPRISRTLAK